MVVGVVGAGACFRVVLNPEHRLMAVLERSHRSVIEVEVSDLNRFLGKSLCNCFLCLSVTL